jgi:hypothetical protein
MDGRRIVVLVALLLPAVLLGVTVEYFSVNPVAILVLFAVMLAGVLYLLSYTDSF